MQQYAAAALRRQWTFMAANKPAPVVICMATRFWSFNGRSLVSAVVVPGRASQAMMMSLLQWGEPRQLL